MEDKRRIIIDTDPGIDDAVALAIALFDDTVEVKLISTVAGNVSIEKVTKNTLQLLTYFEKKIPVAAGSARPLIADPIDASGVHGETGMGKFNFPAADDSVLLDNHAVIKMAKVLNAAEKTTIVAIGPLTNIALLLRLYPELSSRIEEVILMGGAIGRGNSGVYSEFNINADPEAARIVFQSGLKITVIPLEIGMKALIYPEDSEKIRGMNKTGELFYQLFSQYRGGSFKTGLKMYDSGAVAFLLEPSLFTTEQYYIGIELSGEMTRGATLVDIRGYLHKEANVTIATDIDVDRFKDWFLNSIEKCI